MCDHKITIKNPLKGSGQYGLNFLKNTTSTYIQVPCGHCQQCASMRQSFYMQRIQMESLRSHLYYFTLTYNDESLVYTDAGEYQVAYPYIQDIQNMIKRLRAAGHRFRITYCTEYGSTRHRPHFHGILALDKSFGDYRLLESQYKKLFWKEWRRNYNDPNKPRSPIYRPLFTPIYDHTGKCKTFDFHYIEPIMDHENDVSYYVSKYITKFDKWITKLMQKINLDMSLTDEECTYLLDRLRPRCNTSKDFGDKNYPPISKYIRQCASRESDYKYPQYFDLITKKQMPMSPYYAKDLPTFSHLYKRFLRSDDVDNNSTLFLDLPDRLDDIIDFEHVVRNEQEWEKKKIKLYNRLCQ